MTLLVGISIMAIMFGICIVRLFFCKKQVGHYFSDNELYELKQNSFQEGKTEGLTIGFTNGMLRGKKEGESFMKNRCVEFVKETLRMVENDEMELVQINDVYNPE
jgi:hypothetical protein